LVALSGFVVASFRSGIDLAFVAFKSFADVGDFDIAHIKPK